MASMEELIATISGSHISQEKYDLKALQEYLAQNLAMQANYNPSYPHLALSRSTSSTRRSYSSQAATTPLAHNTSSFQHSSDHSSTFPSGFGERSASRPGAQRKTSYGFGAVMDDTYHGNMAYENEDVYTSAGVGPTSPGVGYSNFESDAFAPLWRGEETTANSDPWAKLRAHSQNSAFGTAFGIKMPANHEVSPQGFNQPNAHTSNPFSAFQTQTHAGPSDWFSHRTQHGRLATPPDEDDEMAMDEDEVEESKEEGTRSAPFGTSQNEKATPLDRRVLSMEDLSEENRFAQAGWARGRRKT